MEETETKHDEPNHGSSDEMSKVISDKKIDKINHQQKVDETDENTSQNDSEKEGDGHHQTDSDDENDEQDFKVKYNFKSDEIVKINCENDKGVQINDKNDDIVEANDENDDIVQINDKNVEIVQVNDENDEETHGFKVKKENINDNDFDSFGEGASIYRKYKLRDRRNKPVKLKYEPKPIHVPPSKMRYDHQDNFPCDKCSKILDSRTGLLNHMRKHIAQNNTKYTCAICQEQFDTNKLLIEHKKVHKDCTFTCEKCQLAFTNHLEFLQHEISHTLRSFYKCAECGVYFNKKNYLTHINTHFDDKIQCEVCNALIAKHRMTYHMNDHNLKQCVECNKKIKPSYMSYHMTTHTGVKTIQCLYCGKAFANKCQRKVHTRIHTNERPYECDICHVKFKQSGDMRKHRITHFEGQFKCQICNKKFIHKVSLTSHMSVHNGTQRFKCDICGFKPSTHTGYMSHMLHKHSNERRFKCVFCDIDFKTQHGYNRHCTKSLEHRRNMCKREMKDEEE